MDTLADHWNKIFEKTDEKELGWFENDFSQTLKFLDMIPDWQNSKIFIPGVGTSKFISILAETDAELILNDLSAEAIEKNRKNIMKKKIKLNGSVRIFQKPLKLKNNDIDIWIDRAVLHFLIDDRQVEQYFKNVDKSVKVGGYVIFAEFSKEGAKKCAGLDVRRYDVADLQKNLNNFQLIKTEKYTYFNPNKDPRPYIYALFRKNQPIIS